MSDSLSSIRLSLSRRVFSISSSSSSAPFASGLNGGGDFSAVRFPRDFPLLFGVVEEVVEEVVVVFVPEVVFVAVVGDADAAAAAAAA